MTAPDRPTGEGEDHQVRADGRTVTLTNLERPLWEGFTKGAMVAYYRRVAPAILPHLVGRPVTLGRLPEGVDGPRWYQTNCRGHPPWMRTHEVPGRHGDTLRYCVVDDLPSLLWVANQGAVELHPLLSTVDRPDALSSVMFDLDPGPPATLVECAHVAVALGGVLEDRGLRCFPKTSGFKGLHVVAPLGADERPDAVKSFARSVAEGLARSHPELVVDRLRRDARRGRVLVDWRQNDPNRSMIAPYSLRATAEPGVSTPLSWREVTDVAATGRPEAAAFSPPRVLDRLERIGDLFAETVGLRQRLPATAP